MNAEERAIFRDSLREVIRDELGDMIRDAVADGHRCRLPLADEEVAGVAVVVRAMCEVADTPARAAAEIRENMRWASSVRAQTDRVATAVIGLVATTIAAGLITAVWVGFKILAKAP